MLVYKQLYTFLKRAVPLYILTWNLQKLILDPTEAGSATEPAQPISGIIIKVFYTTISLSGYKELYV